MLSSVQSLSCVWFFVTPQAAALQDSLSITNFRSLFKLMSQVSVMSMLSSGFQFLLSSDSPYPGLYCAVNHFSVVKGFVINRYCLVIFRIRWPLCSVGPQTMMKALADVFPAPMRLATIHKPWLRNACLVPKHIPLFAFVVQSVCQSCLTLCDPMDYSPPRILCPWDSHSKDIGVGCQFLVQGIFLG